MLSIIQRFDMLTSISDMLLTEPDKRGETVLIFTADHGESFGEVEGKFHEQMPYRNMANIPLIIDSPDVSPTRITPPVSHIDIPSTVLRRAGLEVPNHFGDTDILSDASDSEPILIEYLDESGAKSQLGYAYVSDGWKYVQKAGTGEKELYELKKPPGERANVVNDYPETVEEFKELVEDHHMTRSEGFGETDQEHVSSSVKRNLRELGYLDR